jgi:GNAT superfamily N-acetyltransferase
MTEAFSNVEILLRDATISDVPLLALHHRNMFEEIWEKKGRSIDSETFSEMEAKYREKLQHHIPDGSCKAWVIDADNRIIASGAISIVSYVPTPLDMCTDIAFLHSMYTEKDYRKKHCALRIVNQAIAYCKDRGINRIILNASDAARPLYKKIGFQSASETMRLAAD